MPFLDAHVLCRVVLEYEGGPVALRGRGSPQFDRRVVDRLLRAGWLERGGDERIAGPRVSSVQDRTAGSEGWSAIVRFGRDQIAGEWVSASEEAERVVRGAVADPGAQAESAGDGDSSLPVDLTFIDAIESEGLSAEQILEPFVDRPLVMIFSRAEVEGLDFENSHAVLDALCSEYGRAHFMQAIGVLFAGYDDDPRELYEIAEVRAFVIELATRLAPGYYLMPETGGLQVLALCLAEAERDSDGTARVNGHRLEQVASWLLDGALEAAAVAGVDAGTAATLRDAISNDTGVLLPDPEPPMDTLSAAIDARLNQLVGGVDEDEPLLDWDEDEESQAGSGDEVSLESAIEHLTLDDLEEAASEIFNIWSGGSEIEWASHMWGLLRRAGLTVWGDEVERALVFCRLVALAGISREFAARAWGEGEAGEWRENVGADVTGDYPLLDPIALGRLAERVGIWSEPSEDDGRERAIELVTAIAEDQWSTVTEALVEELDPAGLFASLWMSRRSDARYPLSPAVVHNVVNTDVTNAKIGAYSWIENGCC